MPPILSTSSDSKDHPLGTHLLVYLTNSTIIVSRIVDPHLVAILFTSFSYKPFPSIKNIFMHAPFFLFLSSFLSHTFSWAWGACVNPGRFFKFSFYAYISLCLSNKHLSYFVMDFSKLVSALPPCMLCLSHYFEPEKVIMTGCRLIVVITWIASK